MKKLKKVGLYMHTKKSQKNKTRFDIGNFLVSHFTQAAFISHEQSDILEYICGILEYIEDGEKVKRRMVRTNTHLMWDSRIQLRFVHRKVIELRGGDKLDWKF